MWILPGGATLTEVGVTIRATPIYFHKKKKNTSLMGFEPEKLVIKFVWPKCLYYVYK